MRTRDYIWCINYESDTMEANNATNSSTITPEMEELLRKEQERSEFYATYDVMTGIRIAATLGGFFGLMVLLVVYKSKSKTQRALEDPTIQAAAAAEAEEEERQIAAALEATAYEQLNPQSKRIRRSLDTSSVSPRWIRNTKRFSSIAGYASLMEPPIRLSSKLPNSIDEDSPIDDARMLYDDIYTSCYDSHLGVPNRRASNVTCSSSGSSYLERRGSSVMLGLPPMPGHKHQHLQQMRRRQSSPLPEQYDFYYPIDIRVIQPTPGSSPCGSERALYDHMHQVQQRQHLTPRLAPLASISSANSSLANDCTDYDMQSHASYCSDSVFHDIECYEDTDDEIDPFSTDSDENEDNDDEEKQRHLHLQPCCSQDHHRRVSMGNKPQSPLSTISDESTSTLIGVCCSGITGRDCERCERCLQDVGYVDDDVEDLEDGDHGTDVEKRIEVEDNTKLYPEGGRVSRRPSVSSISREMSTSATLGALGATLESLERKRGSCCSMDGTPSPTSSLHSAHAQQKHGDSDVLECAVPPVPQIEIVDVDQEPSNDGEQGVWSKETLF